MPEPTNAENGWDPDYVVPTSEVLQEWLDTNGLSTRVAVAGKVVKSLKDEATAQLDAVLDGAPVGPSEASLLALVTDISFNFWMAFERNYRAGLAAGKHVHNGRDADAH
jgi:hypothetical protein